MIPLDECEHGYVYEIYSRNLKIAAFDAKSGGFIGIRNKFNHEHLDTEYHAEARGTARPLARICKLPVGIQLLERYQGTVCMSCNDFVIYSEGAKEWYHANLQEDDCKNIQPSSGDTYKPLFYFLKKLGKAYQDATR